MLMIVGYDFIVKIYNEFFYMYIFDIYYVLNNIGSLCYY